MIEVANQWNGGNDWVIVIRKFKELTGQEYSIIGPVVAIKLIRN